MSCKVFISIALFALLAVSRLSEAVDVTLSWDPPTTNVDGTTLTDLAGFKVYYGTASHSYTSSLDVGNVTTRTITNLTDGPTYYFAVTAYDTSRNESTLSNEVSKATAAAVPRYTLAVTKAGSGTGTVTGTGINCGADCSELVTAGTVLSLTALASADNSFAGWSGGGCTGTGTCVVTVNAGMTVTATFLTAPPATTTTPTTTAALVTNYYLDTLGRAPDTAGLDYWNSEIRRVASLGIDVGEGFQALAKFFFNSAEYARRGRTDAQFVSDLYETFFNRQPDSAGAAYWQGQLAAGLTRNMLITNFANSTEFALFLQNALGAMATRPENNLINDFYRGFLNRFPDTAGFQNLLAQMRAAQCAGATAIRNVSVQIATNFFQSAEYGLRNRTNREFVEDLYNAMLSRGADAQGFASWINVLSAGRSRIQVLNDFAASPEFSSRIDSVIAAGCLQ